MAKKQSEAERKRKQSEYMKRYWARKKAAQVKGDGVTLTSIAHPDAVDTTNHKTVTAARIALLDKVRSLVEANVISHGEAWSITERIFQ